MRAARQDYELAVDVTHHVHQQRDDRHHGDHARDTRRDKPPAPGDMVPFLVRVLLVVRFEPELDLLIQTGNFLRQLNQPFLDNNHPATTASVDSRHPRVQFVELPAADRFLVHSPSQMNASPGWPGSAACTAAVHAGRIDACDVTGAFTWTATAPSKSPLAVARAVLVTVSTSW